MAAVTNPEKPLPELKRGVLSGTADVLETTHGEIPENIGQRGLC